MITNYDANNTVLFKHSELNIESDSYNIFTQQEHKSALLDCRAVLFKETEFIGIKTALWINLENENNLPSPFTGFKGLWLLQMKNGKVFFQGSKNLFVKKSLGGRMINGIDVLNYHADWVNVVALHNTLSIIKKTDGMQGKHRAGFESVNLSEQTLLKKALRSFIGELDSEVVDILKIEQTGDNSIYNYYISSSEYNRNRVQAAKSYQWFCQSFRNHWKLGRCVDNAEPLLSEIAKVHKLHPRTIKYLQRSVGYSSSIVAKLTFVKVVDKFSSDYLPKTVEDQQTFIELAGKLVNLGELLQVSPMHLAKPFKGNWKAGLDRLEKKFDSTLDLDLIIEMMDASFYFGVLPILRNNCKLKHFTSPSSEWYSEWFSSYGLNRLIEMSIRWQNLKNILCILLFIKANKLDDLEWESLHSINFQHNTYQIVELTSHNQLKDEGSDLEHCVERYTMKCLISGSYIYSVQNRLGKSLSTFEIQFADGQAKLLQHFAKKDSQPTKEDVLLVKLFIDSKLNSVEGVRVNAIQKMKKTLATQVQNQIGTPNSKNYNRLSHGKKELLEKFIKYTHPSGMNSDSIRDFFYKKVNKENTAS